MPGNNTGSVSNGRDLYDQKHPTAEQRAAARANTPKPKRGEKSVAAGRALHDNRGKYDPSELVTGADGTDV